MSSFENIQDSRLCGLPLDNFRVIHIVSHCVFYAFMSTSCHLIKLHFACVPIFKWKCIIILSFFLHKGLGKFDVTF